MLNNKNSTYHHVVNSCFGPSYTCMGKIARTFGAISACSFCSAISSAIASSITYPFNLGSEKEECRIAALSSFSVAAAGLACTGFIVAVCIGKRSCGRCDVYSSTASSLPTPPPPPNIMVLHSISPNSSASYNVSSSISPTCDINSSSTSPDNIWSVMPIKPINGQNQLRISF